MFEDDSPKPDARYSLGDDLEKLSVVDLEELMNDLATESDRVKAEIGRKRGDISAAESLFKS